MVTFSRRHLREESQGHSFHFVRCINEPLEYLLHLRGRMPKKQGTIDLAKIHPFLNMILSMNTSTFKLRSVRVKMDNSDPLQLPIEFPASVHLLPKHTQATSPQAFTQGV